MYGSTSLNPGERRIVRLVARGLKNEDIARKVGTTEHVIKNKLREIFDKVGLDSRLQLALWWAKNHCEYCKRLRNCDQRRS